MTVCSFEGDYIQLNQLMKKVDWVGSGGEAKAKIEQGQVRVNGQVASEIRKKLRDGDTVEYGNQSVRVQAKA